MISRRDLLFSMARRLRGADAPVSGIGADIGAADTAYSRQDYASARDLYRDALKTNREHKEARIRLGLCHYHLGEYLQAKDALLHVVKQHPAEYLARLYLGLAYARRGQLDKCMDTWKNCVNVRQIGVMREMSVQRALYETGEALTGAEIAEAVEKALQQG